MAHILVVNDEDDLLQLCALTLAEQGHDVFTANTEEGAVDLAAKRRPDVLLLDLVIPFTCGEQVWEAIRQRAGAMPLVVMSASSDGPERARAMRADAFIAKPFTEEKLIATIAGILARAAPRA
jgi:DNA-binding response OmpR family regulator